MRTPLIGSSSSKPKIVSLTKRSLLAAAVVLLLSACADSSKAIRKSVGFCDVAEQQEAEKGDPVRTQEQKAYHNGVGEQLCGWKP